MPKRRRRRGNLKKQVIASAGKTAKRDKVCLDPEYLIPTGSTLLNCACADNPWAGYGLGKLVNLIGDSSAGKTFLALTCLADACLLDRFNDYRIIYDKILLNRYPIASAIIYTISLSNIYTFLHFSCIYHYFIQPLVYLFKN